MKFIREELLHLSPETKKRLKGDILHDQAEIESAFRQIHKNMSDISQRLAVHITQESNPQALNVYVGLLHLLKQAEICWTKDIRGPWEENIKRLAMALGPGDEKD